MNILKRITSFALILLFISCASFQTGLKSVGEQDLSMNLVKNMDNKEKNIVLKLILACIQTYNSFEGKELTPIGGYQDNPEIFYGLVLGKIENIGLIYRSVNESPLRIIVAFRGSKTWQDWVNDFRFKSTDEYNKKFIMAPENILVEKGFFETYEYTRNKLMDRLKEIVGSKKKTTIIYITGHSLGAASATLFALDLNYNSEFSRKENVYSATYASPRVGNQDFVDVFSQNVTNSLRVVNQTDTIPELPLKDTFNNYYEHVNTQFTLFFYLKKYDMRLTLPGSDTLVLYIFRNAKLAESRGVCHAAENYYESLKTVLRIDEGFADLSEDNLIILNPFIEY